MRTAMVAEDASPLAAESGEAGGKSIYVAELSAAMAARGHDVTVYTRRSDPDSPRCIVTSRGYTVVQVDAGPAKPLPETEVSHHLGKFSHSLAEQWVEEPPDVVHAHYWTSGVATELATRGTGIPTVQTFHELGAAKDRQLGRRHADATARTKLEGLVARHASWIVATHTDELQELIRLGCSRSHASVVPCGVDVEKFSTTGPSVERGNRPRIVAVGTSLAHKGFDTIIIALRAIPQAELVIVGGADVESLADDDEVRRLSVLASELGVAERVVFTGAIPHDAMPEMLRSADVVLSTPWSEGFGIVPLEAMACGIPVVASAVGGVRDTIVHDVTGSLVPPRNPRAIAAATSTMLNDAFLRRSQGLAGRDRACARYAWNEIADEVLRIYEGLLDARPTLDATPPVKGYPTIEKSAEF
ncbi:glycosyltransferase [Mycolicibacterium aichiense]|uniref:Glycosyl transferase n=1 Tax=Mycolicibacterium aichiense TaxID=1799 RepID=A0AAD1HNC6_9MYCO|nr:glycosyltransferase [Mycolicibacterium aichiense]MCV7019472.1 glycosyltransferase [Mycolicibacterium aichiense]BBX08219.1 glycosyl transferase [Mycolicibacterium aichiense]STZ82023.1 transferase [Mycolicibacterium aichiense]